MVREREEEDVQGGRRDVLLTSLSFLLSPPLLFPLLPYSQELEASKDTNVQLKKTQTSMDDELHTLTENLFEVKMIKVACLPALYFG